jgi:hypothetical protein
VQRLERFSRNTHPLVNRLKGPADDLGPTVRDLGDLAPDLEGLFRDLSPLIRAGRTGLPDLERFLRGGEPVFDAARMFLPELNPILSLLNFQQATVAGFISGAAPDLTGATGKNGDRYQTQVGVINARSFDRLTRRPLREIGNAYQAPNAQSRGIELFGGRVYESFDCRNAGGERRHPIDSGPQKSPPCFVQPPSLYSGKQFNLLRRGQAPVVRAPRDREGNAPSDPDRR